VADITVKMDVKIDKSAVTIGDIKVKFNALAVTEPVTVPPKTDAKTAQVYGFPFPSKVPFMLVLVPTPDTGVQLRDNDLQYSTKKDGSDAQSLTTTQLFFNSATDSLNADDAPDHLYFWNTTTRPIKVQVISGFNLVPGGDNGNGNQQQQT
jgi:hypothetical protein